MNADELYLDLLALRELYILLLKTCLRDANSELLDERAQMVLKHLLDDATAGVLEFHSKNLATDSGNFYNFLHKDDKQTKPLDEKVAEWIEHNQTARNMGNLEIEHNPKRARASASNVATNDLSNDISSALRRIELHILSLQRCTSQSRNTRSHISETKLAYCGQSVLQWNETLNQKKVQSRTDHSTLRTRFTEPRKGDNLSRQLRSHLVGGQKVEPIVTNHCSEFVHGFRIPLSQDNDEAMKSPTVETHISKQPKLVNPSTQIDKSGCSVGSKATVRSGMKLNQTRIQEKSSQNSYGRMIMRPTLLDHPSREVRKEQAHNKTHLTTQQESEFTNSESESASSSSWATQQTSESETTDDPSSPSHQDGPPATNSSEASSRYRSSSSSSSISTKAFKFSRGKKESKESKRAIGRFKRLKNKLGLIFHHQHHHHHHHHHNSHNFMWKQLRKIFHRTDNRKLTSKEERYEGKLKKTAMRSVSRKNQVGKFQALAEGLRSHVWRSKGRKKKEVRELNCGKKKKMKGVKKLHWWKMFRSRHGVKLPNKGRVKIGYVNTKP